MAAPLPTGAQIRTLPVLPQVDPRLFAPDVGAAMQNAAVGLKLGQELARLGDLRAQIELERKKRKAEMAATDYKLFEIDHAREFLPKQTQAAIEQANAQRELAKAQQLQAMVSQQTGTQLVNSNVGNILAGVAIQTAKNQSASAEAAAPFARMSPTEQTQATAAAQAAGQMTINPDGTSSLGGVNVSPEMKQSRLNAALGMQSMNVPTTLPNGAPGVLRFKIGPDGSILDQGEVVSQTDLSPAEKRAEKMVPDVQAYIVTKKGAEELMALIDDYEKTVPAATRAKDAAAAIARNAQGLAGMPFRMAGEVSISPKGAKVAAAIGNLSSQIAKNISGGAISDKEFARLDTFLPSITDLATPSKAREGLKSIISQSDRFLSAAENKDAVALVLPKTISVAAQERKQATKPMSALPPRVQESISKGEEIVHPKYGRGRLVSDGAGGWKFVPTGK